jgi:hypothetical protein
LIRGIAIYAAREINYCDRFSIVGYNYCKLHIDKREEIFRCTSKYSRDGQWYGWCIVEWVDSRNMSQTYPGLILGFIQVGMKYCTVIQSSNDQMSMEKMTQDFICKFKFPSNTPTSVVKIESISNPLCVFKNYCGSKTEYFCALPERKWSRYFGDRIVIP